MEEKYCFSIKDMNLFYGDFHALKNINMQIKKGEVTSFIGPSGCGKSTFIKSLNRMNDLIDNCKIKGKILFFGENIYKKYDVNLLRKRVGMVFQKPNPFPFSIYENLAFGAKTHGIKKKDALDFIIEESLKDVGLWKELKDRLKESALSLSGGQQQRLCIARTLAINPEVILMDEPTSALDPISTLKIEELITKLKKDYTIIIVTHNMQQAHRISEKCAFFLLGEMIELDSTQKIFSNPKNKKTKDYIEGRFG
ncbi:phosphate ABC transporter ATP-binding protein PstB [Helicobacter sp. MIT 14-3879]|uniref:phosphate ABC transporter ATP-binding protein PstB n=1 Tax=Helicobacter sp. MIT 14-3879 TaxID=2040649 RepID=UPI000E1E637E|nr:phosphate ABC transporter ATP-binding protein PstB [Helicobacter sp. MIT 14-3879]RDU61307.1 phosphate ABC transporter ATP-binding protein [Helicobacter sp. MIT 14-3879]